MHQNGLSSGLKEGYDKGRWILIDLSDIIVHIFVKEERVLYSLEKLWNKGHFLELTDLLAQ